MVYNYQAMPDRTHDSGVLSTPSNPHGIPRNRFCRQGELDPSSNVEKLWVSLSLSLSDWRYLCQHGNDHRVKRLCLQFNPWLMMSLFTKRMVAL
ncbi:hypothetical protein BDV27DRAFT_149729 [Aspergillus caelatus]|uniref:Uncharacterized protein n=1 Tax=Aspergillus caelatus TaxID=61420 RepID=A0A5N6ZQN0_9EURO|nr:uncharacterized protein BDV27DRAFT_149729 [Aspergillus caelatus]KAE8359276.1 hypothetical protein BDV27DRAFT_149729 [Aspergillus caelatus]